MSERLVELASHCVRCGFCLEACPTFALDGDETRSPRGRIALGMSASLGEIPWSETREAFETCLACRACETACPSGVQYGQIFEEARQNIPPTLSQRTFIKVLSSPGAAEKSAKFSPSQKVPNVPGLARGKSEADVPRKQPEPDWPPLKVEELPPIKGEVCLLRGCVAGGMFPTTLAAVTRLLRRVGLQVVHTDEACCGALMAHGGMHGEATAKLTHLFATLPEDLPLVTFTAGCGSHLRDPGSPLADRAIDVTEVLLAHGLKDQLVKATALSGLTLTYHDACHLAHGQGVRNAPRDLLKAIPGLRFVDLKESDMCCGSAGTYNIFEPQTARRLLNRKWANIVATGAHIVAQGNAGCHTWIGQAAREHGAQVKVMHTAEVLESAFSGLP